MDSVHRRAGASRCDQLLSVILIGLSLYAGVMAVPLLLVGAFTGPTVLLAGLVHAALAPILLLLRPRLLRGEPAARWGLAGLSAMGVMALPIAIAQSPQADRADLELLIFPLCLSALGAFLIVLLLRSSAKAR